MCYFMPEQPYLVCYALIVALLIIIFYCTCVLELEGI